jgi:hypothetical protein
MGMSDVTAIVISFLRPGFTEACIRSLRACYPDIRVIVGENGEIDARLRSACAEVGARYVVLPFDSGVCRARNRLVSLAETEFVLVGDDDFLYDAGARADDMAAFLRSRRKFDLIGGRITENGKLRDYQGYSELVEGPPRRMVSHALDPEDAKTDSKSGLRFMPADLTFNYFVARTEKVRAVPWDEEIKVAYEHFSWFFDFKLAGNRAAFSPDPVVIHKPKGVDARADARYRQYRVRKDDKRRFFERFGIAYFVGMEGAETPAPQDDPLEAIEFAVTTFMRPEALRRLLLSVAEFAPTANVTVADQSFDAKAWEALRPALKAAGLKNDVNVIEMPHDAGLSASRNRLVSGCGREMVFLLDDDFVFTERTDAAKLARKLKAEGLDLVAGAIDLGEGRLQHYEGRFERDGGRLRQVPADRPPYDYVFNFFVAKTSALKACRWDEGLKVAEHMDYFLSHKGKLKLGYDPSVSVLHLRDRSPEYSRMRGRSYAFTARMMVKHGLDFIRTHSGDEIRLPDMREKAAEFEAAEPKREEPCGRVAVCRRPVFVGNRRYFPGAVLPEKALDLLDDAQKARAVRWRR